MADPVTPVVTAAEKTVEHDLKTPANVNWLFVVGAALIANFIGVIFHI